MYLIDYMLFILSFSWLSCELFCRLTNSARVSLLRYLLVHSFKGLTFPLWCERTFHTLHLKSHRIIHLLSPKLCIFHLTCLLQPRPTFKTTTFGNRSYSSWGSYSKIYGGYLGLHTGETLFRIVDFQHRQ